MLNFLKKNKYKILLTLVLFLALFLRAYNINSIPPGIYPDEAVNANDASEALNSGNFQIFYTDNNGREGFFINLIALSFYLFGIGLWQLKLPSIIIGIFTIFVVYLLTKEIFKETKYKKHSEKIALLSSFFIATSFWHIDFSRIAFRGILTPLILSFAVFFLLLALRKNKWYFFVITALMFSVGGYIYPALLPMPFLAIFAFLFFYFKSKNSFDDVDLKIYIRNILLFISISFFIFAPFFNYFSNNFQDNSKRYSQLSIFSSENYLYEISKNTASTLLQFNIKGDCNPRHNYNCQAQLFWPIGIFFIIGIITFFIHRKTTSFSILLFWFFLLLLPAILTNEGLPHALRSIGSLVPAYIFAGFGAFLLFDFLTKQENSWIENEKYTKYKKQLIRIRKEIIALSLLLLLFSAYAQAYKYFDNWALSEKTALAFGQKYSNISEKINSFPKDKNIYLIVNTNGTLVDYLPIEAEVIKFLSSKQKITYLKESEIENFKFKKKSLIVPLNQTVEIFKKIQKNSPKGSILLIENVIFYETK